VPGNGNSLTDLLARVQNLMDDLQAFLSEQEAQARRGGDRQAAQTWQQRRLRLRAYRQGLLAMLDEELEPPPHA
jgi:hypothetical protein